MSDGYSFKLRNRIGEAVVGGDKGVGAYEFEGPGMPEHGNTVVVWREYDAEGLSRLLARAFEAGKAAQRKIQREAMGVFDTPWGMKVR